jgi:uncharacterized protein YoxC
VETLVAVSKVILFLSGSALCIYLIVVLIRVNKLIEVLQRELVDLNKNLKPILENLNSISEKLRQIATKIDDQVNMVHGVFVAFRRITDNVTRFEERFQQMLEEPLMKVSSLFGNVINRVVSMFGRRASGMM